MSLKRIYISKDDLVHKRPMVVVHPEGGRPIHAFEVRWDGPTRVVYWPQGPVPAKVFVEVEGPVVIERPDLGVLD